MCGQVLRQSTSISDLKYQITLARSPFAAGFFVRGLNSGSDNCKEDAAKRSPPQLFQAMEWCVLLRFTHPGVAILSQLIRILSLSCGFLPLTGRSVNSNAASCFSEPHSDVALPFHEHICRRRRRDPGVSAVSRRTTSIRRRRTTADLGTQLPVLSWLLRWAPSAAAPGTDPDQDWRTDERRVPSKIHS